MFEYDKKEYSFCDNDCKELIEKFLTIGLPVTITPCVKVKSIKAECCGNAIIMPRHETCCQTKDNDKCEFTIIQKMKVEIPVEFSAETLINDPFVDCEFRKDKKDDYKDEEYKDYKDDHKEHKEHKDYADDYKDGKEHKDCKEDYKEHKEYKEDYKDCKNECSERKNDYKDNKEHNFENIRFK